MLGELDVITLIAGGSLLLAMVIGTGFVWLFLLDKKRELSWVLLRLSTIFWLTCLAATTIKLITELST